MKNLGFSGNIEKNKGGNIGKSQKFSCVLFSFVLLGLLCFGFAFGVIFSAKTKLSQFEETTICEKLTNLDKNCSESAKISAKSSFFDKNCSDSTILSNYKTILSSENNNINNSAVISNNNTTLGSDRIDNKTILSSEKINNSANTSASASESTGEDLIKDVEYYNNLLKDKTIEEMVENNTLVVLQRAFVETIGYDNLISFLSGENEEKNRAMLEWLFFDQTALNDFVTGGKPNGGNYINALNLLSNIYFYHSEDLFDESDLFSYPNSSKKRGDLYRTMMISLALTNAKNVYGWVNANDILDPLKRYDAMKFTYLNGNFHFRNEIFEDLCVEEMRYLMSSRINSEEIYWLNAYATTKYLEKNSAIKYPQVYSPHSHIRYGRDWNYAQKGYYEEENFSVYDEKYMLSQYGVSLTTTPRLWMAMDGSQICWGISYLGTNFASAFGVPSHYVRQPDHAAFFVLNKDTSGRTTWSIDNDIFGWTKSWLSEDTVGNGNNRMMCDWGTLGSKQVKHYNGTYILLSQTALDNQQDYEKAELILSLKSLYSSSELESLYRSALSVMPYHLDAWLELIDLYISQNKSDAELELLCEEIASNMYCFPLPMHELITLIKNELKSRYQANNLDSTLIEIAKVENIDNIFLQKATKVDTDEQAKQTIAQTSPCVQEAKYLLGLNENAILASFSFDGENQNKIVFNFTYSGVRYVYSLNGGSSWSETFVTSDDDLSHLLTNSELESLTSENDIYIWLEGWGTTKNLEKAFRIDILDGEKISSLEANDNENKFFGNFSLVEYSLDNLSWQDLTQSTIFDGEKTVFVRYKRSGTTLAGETSTFAFTNNVDENRSYISIDNLELFDFSSEEQSQNDYAKNAIDATLSSRWHTVWKGGDSERYLTVKLNENRFISGLDYTPVVRGGNGTMYACNVFVSTDGETWTLAGSSSGWANNDTKKSMTFSPVLAKFIKVVGTSTVGGFCSARLLEFFEDTTLKSKQISSLELVTTPKIDVYVSGQEISYSGLKAKIVFEDDTFAIIPNELLILEKITFTELGKQTIVVGYKNFSTSFSVEVIDVSSGVARVGTTYFSSLENAIESITSSSSETTIELLKDVSVTSGYAVTTSITINGNNHTLTRNESYLSEIFSVSGSATLTIINLTIDGGAIWTGDENEILGRGTTNSGIIATSPLIKATENSTLILTSSTLQNNYNNFSTNAQNTGGAIFLGLNNAKAVLTNTNIKNCYSFLFGSAIYVRNNSSLTINSGNFSQNSGNSAKNTSLFCIDNNASCTINGGNFSNNLCFNAGGAFWVSNGSLTINGGNFENNFATKGDGIFLNGSAKVYISDFENFGEIYLPSNKFVYILGMLLNKNLVLSLQSSTANSTVAVCDDEEIIHKALRAIKVDGKLLFVDGNNIKIGEKSQAVASILVGENEILFENILDALKCANSGETITLKNSATIDEEILLDKTLSINFSNFVLSCLENLKSTPSYCLKYSDNLISVSKHVFNQNITYTFSTDNLSCTAVGYCECGEEFSETVATKKIVTTPASTTSEEISTFVAEFTKSEFNQGEQSLREKTNVITGDRLPDTSDKDPSGGETNPDSGDSGDATDDDTSDDTIDDDTTDSEHDSTTDDDNDELDTKTIIIIFTLLGLGVGALVGIIAFLVAKRKKNKNKPQKRL